MQRMLVMDLAAMGVDDILKVFEKVTIIDINKEFDEVDNIISYLEVVLVKSVAIMVSMAAWNSRPAYNSEIIVKEKRVETKDFATLNYIVDLFMV